MKSEISRSDGTRERTGPYLAFFLGHDEFGVPVSKVREIIPAGHLRRCAIPVVDLRRKFAMPPVEETEQTCILVADVRGNCGMERTGILVDGVIEVQNVGRDDLALAPDFGVDRSASFLLGMAQSGSRMRLLLDIDELLGGSELRLPAAG